MFPLLRWLDFVPNWHKTMQHKHQHQSISIRIFIKARLSTLSIPIRHTTWSLRKLIQLKKTRAIERRRKGVNISLFTYTYIYLHIHTHTRVTPNIVCKYFSESIRVSCACSLVLLFVCFVLFLSIFFCLSYFILIYHYALDASLFPKERQKGCGPGGKWMGWTTGKSGGREIVITV